MRAEIIQAIARALRQDGNIYDVGEIPLEHPANLVNGDYSSSVALKYFAARRLEAKKELKLEHAKQADLTIAAGVVGRSEFQAKNPKDFAEAIARALRTDTQMKGMQIDVAKNGFINFYLPSQTLAASLRSATSEDMWGATTARKGQKIMVEYTDPNPFKQFHIGHLMSNATGEAISRLLQFSGAEVKRANYQGDVGPHVAKTIWAIKNKKAPDGEWGAAYVIGNTAYEGDENAKKEIDEINAKVYDRSDAEINALYDAGRKASLAHFEDIYAMLGTKFDYYFFESDTAPRGLALVKKYKKFFEESDGALVYKGEKVGLHTRVFVTSKGLPTYETKDLGLAELKAETWPFDTSITVTAHEQSGYFEVVLAAMKEILPSIAAKIMHISHGMMRFAEGKMSSRTGNVITGESLLQDLTEAAKVRAADSRATDHDALAQAVAVAAIKYQILKQASGKDIVFDRERALSLEGDSGPYLQYAHARTSAILEKAKEGGVTAKVDANVAPDNLVRLLHRFPEIVEYATSLYEPHLLTSYLLEIASAFNSWYAQVHILDGTPDAAHKVAVADAVRRTLKNGLWILGIPAPEKM